MMNRSLQMGSIGDQRTFELRCDSCHELVYSVYIEALAPLLMGEQVLTRRVRCERCWVDSSAPGVSIPTQRPDYNPLLDPANKQFRVSPPRQARLSATYYSDDLNSHGWTRDNRCGSCGAPMGTSHSNLCGNPHQ